MAKYYYDRYGVDSSTTYTWSKYNTVSTTTYTWSKYNVDSTITYSEGPWKEKYDIFHRYPDYQVEGYPGYTISNGKFQTTGTYYSGPIGDAPSILYKSQNDNLMGRYTYELLSTGNYYEHYHESTLESVYSRGSYISQTSGQSYSYKTNNARNSDGYWWVRGSASTTYSRGSYISQTSGRSYSYKTNNARNSDGYWWVRGSSSTAYSRGSYIDTITAEDGTYPTDGRVGTTYWYVRGSILTHTVRFKDWDGTTLKTQTVNDGSSATPPSNPSRSGYSFDGWSGTYTNVTSDRTITATYSYIPVPPSIPSSITVPTDIKGGKELYISWGSSTGASSYYLYRSIDSEEYVSVYSGTSRNYTDTIPKGANTVSYRVRAYNSDGYSSYRTSDVMSVKNFPELQMKINGVLKTSDKGWVKVNGELKEIDTIWTMINGILKEVQ